MSGIVWTKEDKAKLKEKIAPYVNRARIRPMSWDSFFKQEVEFVASLNRTQLSIREFGRSLVKEIVSAQNKAVTEVIGELMKLEAKPVEVPRPTQVRGKIVRQWDESEIKSVAGEYALLYLSEPFLNVELFEQAQRQVLPGERQKCHLKGDIRVAFLKNVAAAISDLTVSKTSSPIVIEKEVQVPAAPVDVDKLLNEMPIPKLGELLIARILAKLEPPTAVNVVTTAAAVKPPPVSKPAPPALPVVPETDKIVKTKIGVCGLLNPEQENHVKKKTESMAHRVELVFLPDRINQLPLIDGLVYTKHNGHPLWHSLRKKLGKNRSEFADGGISTVVRKIYDLASRI